MRDYDLYDDFELRVIAKVSLRLRDMTISGGNKVEYPRGASVRCVVYFHAHLSCIRSNYFFIVFHMQTLILAWHN